MNFEEFMEFWQTKPESPESRLARNYRRAQSALESLPGKLLKCLRVEKTSKGLIPAFSPEVEDLYDEVMSAENRVVEARADIETFLELTEGEASLEKLAEKIVRARRTLSDATYEASVVHERAVRQNRTMDPLEVKHLEVVQAAFEKRDRLKAELEPAIADYKDRLAKAKTIIEKYPNT